MEPFTSVNIVKNHTDLEIPKLSIQSIDPLEPMRVMRFEYLIQELDPKLTDTEIEELPQMLIYYKYYSDQLKFR